MKSMLITSGSVALILNLMEVYLAAASRVTAEQSVQAALETQNSQTGRKMQSSLSEMEMRSNQNQTQRWDTMGAHEHQLDSEFYDLCVMDNKRGRACTLWSDPNRGWKAIKTGSLMFITEPTWLSFAVRFSTSKAVSHSAMIAWFKYDATKGYLDVVAEYEEDAVMGIVEVTSGTYTDIQSGSSPSGGFLTHTFYGKMLQEAVGTQLFIKPRKNTMNQHQLTVLRTITSCMHARRPDYVHKDVVSGILKFWDKDAIIYRWHLTRAKTTTEEDENYDRMVCSQMTALLVMEFDGPMQEVDGGVLQRGGSIRLSSEVDQPGCALLPGDFDPGDLKRMSLPTYGPVYELQLPWLHYPEYQALHDQQKALVDAHPLGRTWASFAQECKAGIEHLDYVKDYTPLWRRSMLSWLEDVNETFDGVLSFHDLTDHELYEIMSSPTGLDKLKCAGFCVKPRKLRTSSATID